MIRNIGSSIGISIMQVILSNNLNQAHADLVTHVRPDNPLFRMPQARVDLMSLTGLRAINGEITRQAAMIAYVDDFRLMLWITLAANPLLIFMRPPRRNAAATKPDLHAAID